jgi:hypothetical protein
LLFIKCVGLYNLSFKLHNSQLLQQLRHNVFKISVITID